MSADSCQLTAKLSKRFAPLSVPPPIGVVNGLGISYVCLPPLRLIALPPAAALLGLFAIPLRTPWSAFDHYGSFPEPAP
jgi:hypothetical protein